MTPEEAFQFGFIARCVEEGLSADDIVQRAEKLASTLEKTALNASDVVGAGMKAVTLPLTAAALFPVATYAAGRGLGSLAAQASKTDPEDEIEWAKKQELKDEYDRRISELRKLQMTRGISGDRRPSGRRVGF